MNSSGVRAAIACMCGIAFLAGAWMLAPSKAQGIERAKNLAAARTGVWVYEGVGGFANPHDETGVYSTSANLISRPGESEKYLFRSDPLLDSAPKGTRFELVPRSPGKQSETWDDYLAVALKK